MATPSKEVIAGIRASIAELQKRLDELSARLSAFEPEEDAEFRDGIDTFFSVEPTSFFVERRVDAVSRTADSQVAAKKPRAEKPAPAAAEPEDAGQPEPELKAVPAAPAGPRQPQWAIDLPGSEVSNIISAISLNDRVLFINTLFRGDVSLFQNTISALNGLADFDEARAYVESHFHEWNPSSETVYRFMMAVRRKLR